MPETPHIPEPRFTVVAPMLDEAGAVESLAREIAAACTPLGPFEAIFVDDGSTDGTTDRIKALGQAFPWLRAIRHVRPCGQSAAIRTGVLTARAAIVVTLDGDGQNPPAEIPRLLAPLLDHPPALGLVAGQRTVRHDSITRRLASYLANGLRAGMLGDGARDSACGLKAFPQSLYLSLPYFDNMHRYLPALVRREGFRVLYLDVGHCPRLAGRSKYTTPRRALAGITDLIGVWWLLRRRRLPEIVAEDP